MRYTGSEKVNSISDEETVECRVCGERFKFLPGHLKHKHNMTTEEYKRNFGGPVISGRMSRQLSVAASENNKKGLIGFGGHIHPKEWRVQHSKDLMKEKITKICEGCGKEFKVLPCKEHKKFCSIDCYTSNGNPMSNPESVRKLALTQKKRLEDPKARQKHVVAMRQHWDNLTSTERDSKLKEIFKGRKKRPTSIEKDFMSLTKRQGFSFKYVGDGYTFIASKCPDFINFEDKLIIELFGDYWHDSEEEPERIAHFAKYGYRTLVIWEHELKELPEAEIVNKIKGFIDS